MFGAVAATPQQPHPYDDTVCNMLQTQEHLDGVNESPDSGEPSGLITIQLDRLVLPLLGPRARRHEASRKETWTVFSLLRNPREPRRELLHSRY